jgi:hypothetical protein
MRVFAIVDGLFDGAFFGWDKITEADNSKKSPVYQHFPASAR